MINNKNKIRLDWLENKLKLDKKIISLYERAEFEIKRDDLFCEIDNICEVNSLKILRAMQKNRLSYENFNSSFGYGYDDVGRDGLEKIYCDAFDCEDALVRSQISSGTHAIALCLKANLNFNDELISITGRLYDSIDKLLNNKESGLIKNKNLIYKEIELIKNNNLDIDFDYELIKKNISDKTRIIFVQRSRGYEFRKSININKIRELVRFIRELDKNKKIIILVDNCYCELCDYIEPSELKVDLTCGSLMKNIGGGLAKTGGYILGNKDLINKCALELNCIGKNIGASLNNNFDFTQGLFYASLITNQALKTSIFCAKIFELLDLDYKLMPDSKDSRPDITQAIKFKNKEELIKFCEGIQKASPLENFIKPEPYDMPGYDSKIIMAAGTFIQGSSIELTCDAPMREPYIAYLQGGINYFCSRVQILIALNYLLS